MVNTRLATLDPRTCPGPEDPERPEHYLVYGRPNQIPNLVGKTDHNVGGLACILGLINSHNQSPSLPRNVVPRDQWWPPTRVGKASKRPSVLPSIARQNCD